tara:strand:- start:32542 stop:33123 length:582 start_codon:yes stop_codon:yes gene_type:complete
MKKKDKPSHIRMVQVYEKHKNLKLAAKELGMVWQTLYWNLVQINHPVTGDKERYGSLTDKLAKETEDTFKKTVPFAVDCNEGEFQAKMDFKVKGFNVDVKASTKKDGYKNNPKKNASYRWAFSCKVQNNLADFIVCYCYKGYEADQYGEVEKILLIPKEFFKNKQSISVSCSKSKWYDFEVTEVELLTFFSEL